MNRFANAQVTCMRWVFRQTSVPNLREPKQPFDDPESMFDSGADLRLRPILELLGLIDLTVVTVALIDEFFAFGARLRITFP